MKIRVCTLAAHLICQAKKDSYICFIEICDVKGESCCSLKCNCFLDCWRTTYRSVAKTTASSGWQCSLGRRYKSLMFQLICAPDACVVRVHLADHAAQGVSARLLHAVRLAVVGPLLRLIAGLGLQI